MNNTDQYQKGYTYFYEHESTLTNDQLKQLPQLFRRGYRTAQEEYNRKNNSNTIPTTLYNVPKKPSTFTVTWNDIMAATRRPRYDKLHREHMKPLLLMLVSAIDKNSDKIYQYSDVVQMVDDAFDIILQFSYDNGILTTTDLEQYNYSPK